MKREMARQLHDAIQTGIAEWIPHAAIEFVPHSPPDKYDETLVIVGEGRNVEIIYAAEDHILLQENGNDPNGRQTFLWLDGDLVGCVKNVIQEWLCG